MKQTEGSGVRKRTSTKKQLPVAAAQAEDDSARADEPEATLSREARIREVAYALYVSRGEVDGNDVDDWLAAEAVVSGESQAADPNVGPAED